MSWHLHTHIHTPSLRHCRISPPEDMFFSASISLKLSELAKTSTSTMAISRVRKITAVSDDMPCVASMPSISVWQRHTIIKNTNGTVWCHSKSVNTFCYNTDHSLSSVQRWKTFSGWEWGVLGKMWQYSTSCETGWDGFGQMLSRMQDCQWQTNFIMRCGALKCNIWEF